MQSYTLAINMAMTLDGKVVRPDGRWYGLSSRTDKMRMDVYRSRSDALLLGKNSIINDDPVIHIRYIENAIEPIPILLIRNGTIDKARKVFKNSIKPIILCTNKNYSELTESISNLAEIISIGEQSLPEKVLEYLISRGYTRILLEGGPTLNDSFFRAGLVNKIYLTIVPFIIGQTGIPGISNSSFPLPDFDKNSWVLISNEKIENEVFLEYNKLASVI